MRWRRARWRPESGRCSVMRAGCAMGLRLEPARDALAVVHAVAEELARGEGAAQVEVRVVFPGEADAAVDLDVLLGAAHEGVAGPRLGDAREQALLGVVRVGGLERLARGAAPGLERDQHVGALVLHCLEGADGPPELDAAARVLRGRVEHALEAAHHLGGEERRRVALRAREPRPRGARLADRAGADAGEFQAREGARAVERVEAAAREARGGAVDREEAEPVGAARARLARDYEQALRSLPVDDEGLDAVEHVVRPAAARLHRDAGELRAHAGLERREGEQLAGGDRREELVARAALRGARGGAPGEDRAPEERDAGERAPGLREGDPELEQAEALAAGGLRDGEPREAELVAHLPPDDRVEARLAVHHPSHLAGRGGLGEEAAQHVPELALLVGRRNHAISLDSE